MADPLRPRRTPASQAWNRALVLAAQEVEEAGPTRPIVRPWAPALVRPRVGAELLDPAEVGGAPGQADRRPGREATGFPSALITRQLAIAIVRPRWVTSASAVRSRMSGRTGRRKFTFRSTGAIATPGSRRAEHGGAQGDSASSAVNPPAPSSSRSQATGCTGERASPGHPRPPRAGRRAGSESAAEGSPGHGRPQQLQPAELLEDLLWRRFAAHGAAQGMIRRLARKRLIDRAPLGRCGNRIDRRKDRAARGPVGHQLASSLVHHERLGERKRPADVDRVPGAADLGLRVRPHWAKEGHRQLGCGE